MRKLENGKEQIYYVVDDVHTLKSIYGITSTSDLSLTDVGEKKQALFIILPGEKTTFYPIASLIISQQYELLANTADKRVGRLKQRINFLLDKFGVRPYGLIRNLSVA